ncbi:ATP-binding protein [Streptomyces virginiae]|uniref:ATP-binding protein n=1 Tax=Streptomyces virginiae TaxID=1961 RepID=UPI003324CF4F
MDRSVFLGPPGTGKIHPATGLAVRACQAGYRVAFATAAEWVDRLAAAHHGGRLADELTRLGRYPVIVVDALTPGAHYLRCLSVVLDVSLAVMAGRGVPHRRGRRRHSPRGDLRPPHRRIAARLTGGLSVEAWEAKLAVYGTQYMRRRVSAELVTVQQQLDNPRLWSVAAHLMTLYAKAFPGSDGANGDSGVRGHGPKCIDAGRGLFWGLALFMRTDSRCTPIREALPQVGNRTSRDL